MRKQLHQVKVARLPDVPPFTGGAVGYAGYDVVRYVEDLPDASGRRSRPERHGVCVLRFDAWCLTTSPKPSPSSPWRGGTSLIRRRRPTRTPANALISLVDKLNQPFAKLECEDVVRPTTDSTDYKSNLTEQQFCDSVEKCKEYIRAGDIFQVVLSQRLQMKIQCEPFEIYRSLTRAQSQARSCFFSAR